METESETTDVVISTAGLFIVYRIICVYCLLQQLAITGSLNMTHRRTGQFFLWWGPEPSLPEKFFDSAR